jgi:hypothetical protein
MKFTIDDKTLRRILIGVAVVAVILIIIFFRRRSKFEWPLPTDGTATEQADTNLTNDLNTAQDAYNVRMIGINAMPDGPNKTTAILNSEKTLSDAIDDAVKTYVELKCAAVVTGTKPTDDAGVQAWEAYQVNLSKIGQAYYPRIKGATVSSNPSSTEILAARKADITGATRKYIATVCPKFYKTSADDDPSPGYKNWASYATEAAYNAAPASGTKSGFAEDRITDANIGTWADYAATTYISSTSVSVAAGGTTTGAITFSDVTGLTAGDSVQVTPQTSVNGVLTPGTPIMATIATITDKNVALTIPAAPASGYIFPSKTVLAKALRSASTKWNLGSNWKLARDAGPGTLPQPSWATA